MRYKDVLRPDPIWEEVGIYGGYRWIEFTKNLWISRRFESQLLQYEYMQKQNTQLCNMACLKDIREIVSWVSGTSLFQINTLTAVDHTQDFLVPTESMQNNKHKRIRELTKSPILLVIGAKQETRDFVAEIRNSFKTIYASDTRIIGSVAQSEDWIMRQSATHRVLIEQDRLDLRGLVLNWGNIINI